MKRRLEPEEVLRPNLRKARVERGLTINELGRLVHYSHSAIARAERGTLYSGTKKDIRREAFWKTMSEFFDLPIDYLMETNDEALRRHNEDKGV